MKTINELIDLSGRKALITGGTGHIGFYFTKTLVELGASVTIFDKNTPDIDQQFLDYFHSKQEKIKILAVDLLEEGAVRKAVRTTIEKMGGLDIFIHCAAFVGTTDYPGWAVPFENQSVEAWDAAFRVNTTSSFIIVQEAKQALENSEHASIILISSIYGLVGPDMSLYEGLSMANPAAYGASKGAINQLVRYFSTVLAPKIRVNAITPGGIWRNQSETFVKRYEKKTPLGRMGVEEDLIGAVAYLASDLSSYMTGQNLIIDGGWTAW